MWIGNGWIFPCLKFAWGGAATKEVPPSSCMKMSPSVFPDEDEDVISHWSYEDQKHHEEAHDEPSWVGCHEHVQRTRANCEPESFDNLIVRRRKKVTL